MPMNIGRDGKGTKILDDDNGGNGDDDGYDDGVTKEYKYEGEHPDLAQSISLSHSLAGRTSTSTKPSMQAVCQQRSKVGVQDSFASKVSLHRITSSSSFHECKESSTGSSDGDEEIEGNNSDFRFCNSGNSNSSKSNCDNNINLGGKGYSSFCGGGGEVTIKLTEEDFESMQYACLVLKAILRTLPLITASGLSNNPNPHPDPSLNSNPSPHSEQIAQNHQQALEPHLCKEYSRDDNSSNNNNIVGHLNSPCLSYGNFNVSLDDCDNFFLGIGGKRNEEFDDNSLNMDGSFDMDSLDNVSLSQSQLHSQQLQQLGRYDRDSFTSNMFDCMPGQMSLSMSMVVKDSIDSQEGLMDSQEGLMDSQEGLMDDMIDMTSPFSSKLLEEALSMCHSQTWWILSPDKETAMVDMNSSNAQQLHFCGESGFCKH